MTLSLRGMIAAGLMLGAAPALADTAITIPFVAEIGGQPAACETFAGLGATGANARLLDYRLFVSAVHLIAADGARVPVALDQDGTWQLGDVALLDFEAGCQNGTPETNTTLRGTVPEGSYSGLEFEIGVPFALNHGDPTTAPSPMNLTAMFWNWRGGYKFVKIEFAPEGMAEGSRGWMLHLGSTMCAAAEATNAPAAPCANPNRMLISLPGFDVAANTVVIDPAPVVAGANLTSNATETSPGCMSFPNDPDCNTVLPALGLPFNDFAAGAQQLVSMR